MANVALNKPVLEKGQANVKHTEEATNGNVTEYTLATGYASFRYPGTLTVDLGRVFDIWAIRFLLWDKDERAYTYRLWTAVELPNQELLHDMSRLGTKGWQVFTFTRAKSMRYVIIEGLSNSKEKNLYFHVVQVEAYDTREVPELRVPEALSISVPTAPESSVEHGAPRHGQTCFIIMRVTVPEELLETYYDNNPAHFQEVLKNLFVPAVRRAGYEPIPPVRKGAEIITAEIIADLQKSDLVLCDISALRPNVFFELGVRTGLNKPVAYVKDKYTDIPFDTGIVHHHQYSITRKIWVSGDDEVERLAEHIKQSAATSKGRNTLWQVFGTVGGFDAERA